MKIKLLFVFIFSSFLLQSQTLNIVGRVFSEENIPVEGMKVSITGVDHDTTTSSGEFNISIPASLNLKAGNKIQFFLEETGKPVVEYSIFIPTNSLLDPIIIRLKSSTAKTIPEKDNKLTFNVANYYDEPYGEAYYKEQDKIIKVRCLPQYYHEVHKSPTVYNTQLTQIDDIVKEGYRVILSNQERNKIIVSDIRMLICEYKPLPDRYIVNWEPKGIKKSIVVDVDLNPELKTYKSLKKDEYLELGPDESEIVLFNLKNGIPGIYVIGFEIDVLGKDGNYNKKTFQDKFQILVPDRNRNKGVLLINSFFQKKISSRILNFDEKTYNKIIEESNPFSIYTNDNFNVEQLDNFSDQDLSKQLCKKKS